MQSKDSRGRSMTLVCLLLGASSLAGAQTHYKDLQFPPLRDIRVPEVEQVELGNGMKLYLLEDHSLPKVHGRALIRTGDRFEPAEKTGLAGITGQVMREGGTESRPGEELDELLESIGASVETGIGTSSGSARLFALKEDLPLVLEVLADVLQHPAFPEDKLDLAKVQLRSSIARRNDDVNGIAGREFSKLLYGADHPFARTVEYETLDAITRDDLVDFHRRFFHPNRVALGLWGDFDSAEVKGLVEKLFGDWPKTDQPLPEDPEILARPGSVNFIAKDDVNQTQIRMGHIGGRRDDPDFFALSVMSEILGGGFSSRLFRQVRSARGLAYSVRASWAAAYDRPGSFYVASSTKSESTVETIQAILDEIRRIAAEPVTDEEMAVAKEGILNSFVFNFDGTGEIIRRLMTYDYYGYPADFLESYKSNIEKVTKEDVLRVSEKHLHPDELIILAVGRAQDFDEPLTALGEVNTIDISIPPPKVASAEGELPEATPESLERGEAVVARFLETGGESLPQGFAIEGASVLVTPQGEMNAQVKQLFAAPDRYREEASLPFGKIITVLNGEGGWASTPRGVQALTDDQRKRTRESLLRNYLGLLWSLSQGDAEAQYLEAAEVSGTTASAVRLTIGETSMRATFDQKGRLIKIALPGTDLMGTPVSEERLFGDFEPVEGIDLPRKIEIIHDGQAAGTTTVSSYRLNVAPDAGLFERPPSP